MSPHPPTAGEKPRRLDRLAPLFLSGEGAGGAAPAPPTRAAAVSPLPAARLAQAVPRLIAVGHPTDPLVSTLLSTRLALALRDIGVVVRLVDAAGVPWFRDAVVAEADPLPALTPGAPPPRAGWGEVVVVALPTGSLHPYLTRGGGGGTEMVVVVGDGRDELAHAFARLREGARWLSGGRLGVCPLGPSVEAARTTFHRLARACRTLLQVEVVSDGYLPTTAAALRRATSQVSPESTALAAAIGDLAALLIADGPPSTSPTPTTLTALLQPV